MPPHRQAVHVVGNQFGQSIILNLLIDMTDNQHLIKYEDFVIGFANKTVKFEIKNKKEFAVLFFDNFIAWLMRVLLVLVILPFILIPFFCFKFNNWWLLLGFVGVLFGNAIHGINTKSSRPFKNMVELSLSFIFLLGVLIYFLGLLQPFVFSFACLVYSFFFMDLSNNIYDEIAKNNLLKNEPLYYFAIEKNVIDVSNI